MEVLKLNKNFSVHMPLKWKQIGKLTFGIDFNFHDRSHVFSPFSINFTLVDASNGLFQIIGFKISQECKSVAKYGVVGYATFLEHLNHLRPYFVVSFLILLLVAWSDFQNPCKVLVAHLSVALLVLLVVGSPIHFDQG